MMRSPEGRRDPQRTDKVSASRHLALATLGLTVPIAVILFEFDPYAQLFGDLAVRWGTIALTWSSSSPSSPLPCSRGRATCVRTTSCSSRSASCRARCRGRLGYALMHWSVYARRSRAADRSIGRRAGTWPWRRRRAPAGAYVASLLGAPLGRWLHLAALPALFALGAGKLTLILTGSGQGLPSTDDWATAYLGAGPWGSLAPAIPSNPSQAYEGIATLAILLVLTLVVCSTASAAATDACSTSPSGSGPSPASQSRPRGATRSSPSA